MADTAQLTMRVFDGTRQPFDPNAKLLVTLLDGFQKELVRDFYTLPRTFEVPFSNNLHDDFTVVASAKGWRQVGFHPVRVTASARRTIDLMLLPKRAASL